MADIYVRSFSGPVFTASITDTVTYGSLVYHDGTDFALADADVLTTGAQYICVGLPSVGTSRRGTMARKAILEDADAPYTLGNVQYLSTTAGAITATRPTGSNDLVQVVGRAINTSQVEIELLQPRELTVQVSASGGTDAPTARLDTGNYGGFSGNAQNDNVFYNMQVPQNAIAIVIAYIWLAAEDSGGTPTFDMLVSSSNDGDQWDAVTADITIAASADEGAAADEMQRTDVTTAFDATDILHPGKLLGIRVMCADSGTDLRFRFNLVVVFRVV